jgi:beta-phosphoglucomutase
LCLLVCALFSFSSYLFKGNAMQQTVLINAPAPGLTYQDWSVTETQFDPAQLASHETLFTIGNGYLGTRGSLEEGYPGAMAATLIQGLYDDLPVVYTELVNCPDWTAMVIRINSEVFQLDQGEVSHYSRTLDLKQGILRRSFHWRSPKGETVALVLERWASFADRHLAIVRLEITALDFEGSLEVQSSLSGKVDNKGYSHWRWVEQGIEDDRLSLALATRSSKQTLGIAMELSLHGAPMVSDNWPIPEYPTRSVRCHLTEHKTVTVEKRVTFYTTQESATPLLDAKKALAELPQDYQVLRSSHIAAWDQVWQDSDIVIEGDEQAQLAVRYNLFQVLITASPNNTNVSIPAKTLSGFGYHGHVFWDTEIFILPFLIYTQPHLAKNLLTYRYNTLQGARRKAIADGYKGAMYAWESAGTGDEVTPRWALPKDPYGEDIRIWCRDREVHISADVAYALWQYWQVTGDDEWMVNCGAEILLDTAVFWSSRVEWNNRQERYEIRDVIGADEYHEHVNNNAFTNRMAQWHLEKAIYVYEWLKQQFPSDADRLSEKLGLTAARVDRWHDIVRHLLIHYNPSNSLIEQCDGFFGLEDINLEDYEPRTQSMQMILGIAETNERQVLKQPDTLMLLYLMRSGREFPYSLETLKANWDYYAPRTDITYGSSLGPAIHAILAADLGKTKEAYDRFMQAALVDLEDVRGNASEGIHGASAGGIWQSVVFGFGGVMLTPNGPVAQPHLPSHWTRLKFSLMWKGERFNFDLRQNGQMTQPETAIAGVIFDLDGVLTDTAEYHYQAWQRLADEEGVGFDRAANENLRGVSRRDSLLRILGDRVETEARMQEMMLRKNRYYLEFTQQITPKDLLPGAKALLELLLSRGIKIALGSASKNAKLVIEKLGILTYFDAIADGFSVEKSKPAPDLFLYAAEQIGLAPQQCVVFEDSEAGVTAAIDAGMMSVGLGPTERVGHAQLVLPDLDGADWDGIVGKLLG